MKGTIVKSSTGLSVAYIGKTLGTTAGIATISINPAQQDEYRNRVGESVNFEGIEFIEPDIQKTTIFAKIK